MIRVTELNDELLLVSVDQRSPVASALTRAEQEVVTLARRGLSNDEIARARGCSVSTVANQLASSYRKLSVSGRRELNVKLVGP
jgi:DNA-binding CsgD family transcriptional regulator